jgi:hypothetical protein
MPVETTLDALKTKDNASRSSLGKSEGIYTAFVKCESTDADPLKVWLRPDFVPPPLN